MHEEEERRYCSTIKREGARMRRRRGVDQGTKLFRGQKQERYFSGASAELGRTSWTAKDSALFSAGRMTLFPDRPGARTSNR
jgi:hypothetical protein